MAGELQGVADFRLIEVLGEGERATVYRAVREGSDVELALRVARVTLAETPEELTAFVERAEAGQRLVHPRVLGVVDSGCAAGRHWAALELCDGVSLDQLPVRRKKGRLNPPSAWLVLRELLGVLAAGAAMTPPVVHGRLDAGAVLFDGTGDVRFGGFGTEGDPRADLLALGRLAEALTAAWPPEIDAWLDRLRDGADAFASAAEALEALPPMLVEGEAPDERKGWRAIGTAVRRLLRKRAAAAEEGPVTGAAASAAAPAAVGAAPATAGASPGKARRRRKPGRSQAARTAGVDKAVAAALPQARIVAFLCLAMLVLALAVEVYGFSSAG